MYVKNLAFTTDEAGLSAYVQSKINVAPHSVNIVVTRRPGKFQGRSRGFGFITVPTEHAANTISKINGQELDGRELSIVEAKPRDPDAPRPKRQPRQPRNNASGEQGEQKENSGAASKPKAPKPERKTFPDATQLYVNNLSFETTAEELSRLFEEKTGSKPLDVDIVKSRFGKFKDRSRGFGFVYVSNSTLEAAKGLDTTSIGDRQIGVQIAKPQEEQEAESSAAGTTRGRGGRRGRGRGRRTTGENGDSNESNETGNDEAPNNRRRKPRGDAAQSTSATGKSESTGESAGRGAKRRGRGGRGGRGAAAAAGGAPAAAGETDQ